MDIYLVGGAVRDKLLNITTHDRDWVVVGSTPEEMLALGYQQVGQDFPVFLHPETHEEYALARTERKTAPGYAGFICDSSTSVTLEDDLLRRDLTINAMAQTEDGSIIDPYNGQQDLQLRKLRHVSDAFSEDPLRVLRTARFAARFHHLGFSIADETQQLMSSMVEQGEVDHLIPERTWKETERALNEINPDVFFSTLRSVSALNSIMPEIDALFGVPQPEKHHPEIDTGQHALMCLQQASRLSKATTVRFASLVHDLGKALTPAEQLPRHIGHEAKGKAPIKALCKRIKAPNNYRDLALLACEYHTHCHRAPELKSSTLLKTLEKLDAFRRPDRFDEFLLVCEADSRGRTGFENRDYPQADIFRQAYNAAAAVDSQPLLKQNLQGKAFGEAIRQLRISAIESVRS